MIKILELFGGIGACSKALDNLGIEYEIADYVEIDKYAVKSYNAIHNTNFVPQDICNWDKDIEVDLIMHGSPCQDFSLAGKQAGGNENSGTRSSLMYETLRIVEKTMPKYVIWENVKNIISKKHVHNFNSYVIRMTKLGYKSFYKVLNAKDFEIPQNRERVFTISIRKDIEKDFSFPHKTKLKLKLKDMLENEVNEKYYLSDKMLNYIIADNDKWTGNNSKSLINKTIASTINTHEGSRRCDASNYISKNINDEDVDIKKYKINQIDNYLPIKNATKKGYLKAYDGDYVNLQYPNSKNRRGRVGEQVVNTLLCNDANGVVIYDDYNNHIKSNQSAIGTLTTNIGNSALRHGTKLILQSPAGLRIRKLTPKECWRLMGFADEDFEKAAKVNSDTQLYKQAGNSIVVNVLMAILTNLLIAEREEE